MNASAKVNQFASLHCSDPQAQEIAQEIVPFIYEGSQVRSDFVDAGIIPRALQKLDESENVASRVCYARLLRALTVPIGSQVNSQTLESIKKARRELRELGALFVILSALRSVEEPDADLLMNLSDTMNALTRQMDRVSMPFNELAVPWLVLKLQQSCTLWQVYSYASMLRGCLGINSKHVPIDTVLNHAFSAGCLPVLISTITVFCGQDGIQPIASILKALTHNHHVSFAALGLNIVPAILANIASPQSIPSHFIDPVGEWSEDLDYHRILVRILLKLVCTNYPLMDATYQSAQMHGTVILWNANAIPLLVSRIWCKTSTKVLSNMAERVEKALLSQNGHYMNHAACLRFFFDYATALLTTLANIPSQALQLAAMQNEITAGSFQLAISRAVAALSELSGGIKAILEFQGGVSILVKIVQSVLRTETGPADSLPVAIKSFAVSRHGTSLLTTLLLTLLNIVRVRRGTKGAVAAGVVNAIAPALFVAGVQDSSGNPEASQAWKGPWMHLAAETLARVSSITKGQRQALAVTPMIMKALCAHAAEAQPFLMSLIDVLGNIASTQEGLRNLAFCNAAPALQYCRELMMRAQPIAPEELLKQIEVAEKLHALRMLVKSNQMQISKFFVRVRSSCAFAASKRLLLSESSCQAEVQAASRSNVCPFAVAATEHDLVVPNIAQFFTRTACCGAIIGALIRQIGTKDGASFCESILQYCICKKFDQSKKLEAIQKTFGPRFAVDCIGIQAWIKNHELFCAAARAIHSLLKQQADASSVGNELQVQWPYQLPMKMAAAHLKDSMKLPRGCDAGMVVRSAVSVFSPPLTILGIGEGGSEWVLLCPKPENQEDSKVAHSGSLSVSSEGASVESVDVVGDEESHPVSSAHDASPPPGPQLPVLWGWANEKSDFIDFAPSDCELLEQALNRGASFTHPTKSWLFDFAAMTMTNTATMSKRAIKRFNPSPEPDRHRGAAAAARQAPQSTMFGSSPPAAHAQTPHATSLPSVALLPVGWVEQKSPEGIPLYLHIRTGQCTWERPSEVPVAAIQPSAPSVAVPPGWIEEKDPKSGRTYYVNCASRISQWERPTATQTALAPASQSAQPAAAGGQPYAERTRPPQPHVFYPHPPASHAPPPVNADALGFPLPQKQKEQPPFFAPLPTPLCSPERTRPPQPHVFYPHPPASHAPPPVNADALGFPLPQKQKEQPPLPTPLCSPQYASPLCAFPDYPLPPPNVKISELQAPANCHDDTADLSDDDESHNMVNVWSKLLQAASAAQTEDALLNSK
jgi:hypothetical protein